MAEIKYCILILKLPLMFCFDTLTFYSLYSKMTIVCLFLSIWNIKDSMWWWLALVFWRQNFTNHVLGIT